MKTFIKIAVIVFAAVTCVTRFVLFKYETALSPEALPLLRTVSFAGAAACLIFAALWVIFEKKRKDT